jgi:transcriptional regulator with XRE-family HTH domain
VSLQISLTRPKAIVEAPRQAVAGAFDVGARLRAIRHLRRATLKAVAERANLSESFLSQIERGKASPSVASLTRIAAALGVTVADLFEAHESRADPRVLRRERRPTLGFGNSARKFLLTPRPLENLEVFTAEFVPGGSTGDEPYTHGDSEEFVVVLSGRIQLQLGERLFELETGDSIDYLSSTPHRVANAGDDVAEVMWIISPPSY